MNICITGHRPARMPARYGYDIHNRSWHELKSALNDIVLFLAGRHGSIVAYTGMALGCDQVFAETVFQLRDLGCPVSCVAAVPCYNQENQWPVASRELYHKILSQCDAIQYITKDRYTPDCMDKRNRYMVDHSDIVIAVWEGGRGGTKNCVDYAKSNGKKIIRISPETLQIYTDFTLEAAS